MKNLPLLPLRDILVFPSIEVPLFVGRSKSIKALEYAQENGGEICVCLQRRSKTNDPSPRDIHEVGTISRIAQIIQLPDSTVKVTVEGVRRGRIVNYNQNDPLFLVDVEEMPDKPFDPEEHRELIEKARESFREYSRLNSRVTAEIARSVLNIQDVSRFADTMAAQLSLKLNDKQGILELDDPAERLQRLIELLDAENQILQVERKIRSRVKKQMERTQSEYMQQQRMEKGQPDGDEFKSELEELEARIEEKDVPEHARERLEREFKKLRLMSPMSAEASVIRSYIDVILNLPWNERSEDNLDVDRAQGILDEDHYGLEKPKDRILEYLAVLSLKKNLRGPILCLVGPPGVGKTSLARSIARSLDRRFVRVSLGGVRDEAEIRGHRRTYIGALPGKLIHNLSKTSTNNPVMLLDEIDKMTSDFRGDPSSALLEVLDPEQNNAFNDHYLDLDYDLSEVLFVCTANNLSQIPGPLRDRMEVIEITGYTDIEKLEISREHLIQRQIIEHGLEGYEIRMTDDAVKRLIHGYTREAGVRNLEREIGSVLRKIARKIVRKESEGPFHIDAEDVVELLGPEKFHDDKTEKDDQIGFTNGLAWTMHGGVLLSAEVSLMPGSGKLIITGKLGDVMKESANAALTYVRSRAYNLGLRADFYQKIDIHVHFPEGAQPKDGPSAGVTMVTSLVSALTRIPVRHDIAMTGEITLRGRVLPIGGLKEKIFAAHRAGMRTVLIPEDNEKDLRDVPEEIKDAIEIIPVAYVDEVLGHALTIEDQDGFTERLREPILPPEVQADDVAPATPEPPMESPHRSGVTLS